MQLLQRLCCARLPMNIDADDDIEKCAVLFAAKLIEADIPPVSLRREASTYSGHATVMRVTASGKAASAIRPEHAREYAEPGSPALGGGGAPQNPEDSRAGGDPDCDARHGACAARSWPPRLSEALRVFPRSLDGCP